MKSRGALFKYQPKPDTPQNLTNQLYTNLTPSECLSFGFSWILDIKANLFEFQFMETFVWSWFKTCTYVAVVPKAATLKQPMPLGFQKTTCIIAKIWTFSWLFWRLLHLEINFKTPMLIIGALNLNLLKNGFGTFFDGHLRVFKLAIHSPCISVFTLLQSSYFHKYFTILKHTLTFQ
jgi:hypothetical protein